MRPTRILFLLVLAAALAGAALTASAASNLPDGTERVLSGHGFLPSRFLGDPWVGTYFSSNLGAGAATGISKEVRDLDGNLLTTVEGSVGYAALGLEFQQNLRDAFAVGLHVRGLGRTGTSALSFISEGADADQELAVWGKWRALRTDKVQFTAGLQWTYSKTFMFTPRDFAEYVADNGTLDGAPLVIDTKSWDTSLTWNLAWAMSEWFGVRLSGWSGLYEVPETAGVTKGQHRLGILGSLDLNQVKDIPLGFTAGYFFGLPDDVPQAAQKGFVFGTWYTGETDFQIGVELGMLTTEMVGLGTDVDGVFGLLTLRYWF
ncbi:MAG TPA: hypothetical protein PLQ13_06680 [Candidatus Krumholzibacteria bacterium]|nr:hypothetical protein [Candidatus Krumholzibacteria bacterium]